jgi:iron complex transport system ATP-binding protein
MIEVKNLYASYNGRDVLKQIDLKVERGIFMGLLGPNGSGKTTLLRCISGNLSPRKGTVRIMGRSVDRWKEKELARRMAIIHQDTNPGFDFKVSEIIAMGRYPYLKRFSFNDPEGNRAIARALEWTNMEELKEKEISKLSGGEKQRVFIARAFAQASDILLMDEPTKNLDIRHSMDIMEIVKENGRLRKMAVLTVLHDIDLAARFCDRIALLKHGRVVAEGETEKVLTEDIIRRVFDIKVKVHRGRSFHVEVLG